MKTVAECSDVGLEDGDAGRVGVVAGVSLAAPSKHVFGARVVHPSRSV